VTSRLGTENSRTFFLRCEITIMETRQRPAPRRRWCNCTMIRIFSNHTASLHCKKRLSYFPSPAGMSLTKLSLGGNNLIRECLVSDIPDGDGKIDNLFLQCRGWTSTDGGQGEGAAAHVRVVWQLSAPHPDPQNRYMK
jgi:hypothetical protein